MTHDKFNRPAREMIKHQGCDIDRIPESFPIEWTVFPYFRGHGLAAFESR
jgi:hypothetical protein